MAIVLGIDIGTSATKAIACDEAGAIVAVADAPHTLSMPRPEWTEQPPQMWWQATVEAIGRVLRSDRVHAHHIAALGLSGQMHGSVFLPRDADAVSGEVVRPAILWNDQRTARECEEIERRAGGRDALLRLVGNVPLAGYTAPKILWLRDHEPDAFAATEMILLPKDYIAWRLTGERATDAGDASGTLLLDPVSRDWSENMLAAIDLDRSRFPRVLESQEVTGRVTDAAARATGLLHGTPVVIGSGDQMTGAVGTGVVHSNLVSATLGTSGVVFAHSGRTLPHDPEGRIQVMCAAIPGEYCVYGCSLCAAGAMHWLRDTIAPNMDFATLDHEAHGVDAGADGLFFMPYLSGERCPHPDPNARGAWIGLSASHTRAHLTRSVLEGVAFTMREILDLIHRSGMSPSDIRLSGGGAKSPLWRRIMTDVMGIKTSTVNTTEGSAYGASLLAGVGAGIWDDVANACESCIRTDQRAEPDRATASRYTELQERYSALYPRLRKHYARMSE